MFQLKLYRGTIDNNYGVISFAKLIWIFLEFDFGRFKKKTIVEHS